MHSLYLHKAIELAYANVKSGRGGPFGVIIVKDDVILAEGTNLVTVSNDPTAHAEITAIRRACQKLSSFQLTDCIIYSSCEPCPMCLGAIYWARPRALYFSATRHDAAQVGFDDSFIYDEIQKNLEERHLKTECLSLPESLEPFQLWHDTSSKTSY